MSIKRNICQQLKLKLLKNSFLEKIYKEIVRVTFSLKVKTLQEELKKLRKKIKKKISSYA